MSRHSTPTGRRVVGSKESSSSPRRCRRCRSGSGATTTAAGSRSTYSERFPGVWRHGDWITITDTGKLRHHRSLGRDVEPRRSADRNGRALLDRRGHRRRVRQPRRPSGRPDGGPGRARLLVVARDSAAADASTINAALRSALSPRHVPDEIDVRRAIPRTLSGKKLELPVKRILAGENPDDVASRDALSDPDALEQSQSSRGTGSRVSEVQPASRPDSSPR